MVGAHAAVQSAVWAGAGQAGLFIFDFCQNLEFFSQELEGSEGGWHRRCRSGCSTPGWS